MQMMSPTEIAPYSDRVESLDTTLFFRFEYTHMTDRPDDDATASEIARWMEEDFWEAVTEGINEKDDDVSDG